MYITISILIVVACVLLIGVVLVQKSKGGGLASNYAGGNQIMGVHKTTDFIEKATWTLAIVICLLSIGAAFTIKAPINDSAIKPAAPVTAAPAPASTPAAPKAQAPAKAEAAEAPKADAKAEAAAPAKAEPAKAEAAEAPKAETK